MSNNYILLQEIALVCQYGMVSKMVFHVQRKSWICSLSDVNGFLIWLPEASRLNHSFGSTSGIQWTMVGQIQRARLPTVMSASQNVKQNIINEYYLWVSVRVVVLPPGL